MKTIYDIAKLAGVSKSTVSRVLNNSGYTSPEAREKVMQIVNETGYKPSNVARSLSKGESYSIGVVIPEIENSFFGEILQGIAQIIDEMGWSLICCDTSNSITKEDKVLTALGNQRVRGLIWTPAAERDRQEGQRLERSLKELEVPVVLLDRHFRDSTLSGVFYENEESGYLATKALIEAGNKTVGIITGDLKLRIARERFRGYAKAMKEAGLELDEGFILKGDFTVETAYNLTKSMVARGELPEGIVTSNNLTSLGFLKAMREMRLRIGYDMAVVGIDSNEVLEILDYNFSSISRNVTQMGRSAMLLLKELLEKDIIEQEIQTAPCIIQLRGSERRMTH
jgi:LacI family transcriptional regulator